MNLLLLVGTKGKAKGAYHQIVEKVDNISFNKSGLFPEKILEFNETWTKNMSPEDRTYFKNLTKGHYPKAVVITCSDSRIPLDLVTGTEPGTLFVHRNVCNQVSLTDKSSVSVLQYSVNSLNVEDIIIVGHSHCGGIDAVLSGDELEEPIGEWLKEIKKLYIANRKMIDSLPTHREQNLALVELNIQRVVNIVNQLDIVKNARALGKPIKVYGWVYHLGSAELHNLNIPSSN
ncbi:hypothetical protein BB559_005147 [Furculomyces boomerangus]|uniref:Carbonic anhydrase n=2 Tax=Harpellales TaxID=61421 RepID=A0A2T9Y6V5_9FUNG|nr:hypothetical protein BB559_007413 [Furculomyces boomerangus]PVU88046.1 hypothetical protein BB559_005755 [Furculomyces boomerangus]PVU89315.1 hypothetical protein BB559_005147 [Furculomyces boomerangus]PVZ97722.1 hypothetical protein BB558_006306 [Smittium angustum]